MRNIIKVGFVLNYGENDWAGGINYIRSLIAAIHQTENDMFEPVIFIGHTSKINKNYFSGTKLIKTRCLDHGSVIWYLRMVIKKVTNFDYYLQWVLLKNNINIMSHSGYLGESSRIKTLCWIPDFQHKYLTDNFSTIEINSRNKEYKKMCEWGDAVILSSYDAQNDLNKYFPGYEKKSHVLQFLPIPNSNIKWLSLSDLEVTYGIDTPFFLVPSQFWAHKNHKVVLEALSKINFEDYNFKVIATGSKQDYRKTDCFSSLGEYAEKLGISNRIIFTDYIPYEHMISLMKFSMAVINPSYFEGWSTIVEEAKSLGKTVVLSDINVHREQKPEFSYYFNPDKAGELAELLKIIFNDFDKLATPDFNKYIEKTRKKRLIFAENYLNILEKITDE